MRARPNFIKLNDSPAFLAAKELAAFGENSNFDFSNCAVLLPTRSAGRLVNFFLLEQSKKRGFPFVVGLKFYTPESFLSEFIGAGNVANTFEATAAWLEVFSSLSPSDISAIFPRGKPDSRDFLALAHTFAKLRRSLSEIGEDISSLLKNSAIADCPDILKWKQAEVIETTYLNRLHSANLEVPENAAARALANFDSTSNAFRNLKKLFIFGLCDASAILEKIIRRLEDCGTTLQISVFSDGENCAQYFDDFGRPNQLWENFEMPVSDSDIFVCSDVAEQARVVSQAIGRYGSSASMSVCVACNENDSAPLLADALIREKIDAYIPSGSPISEDAAIAAFGVFSNFLRTRDISVFSDFLRNPLVLKSVARALEIAPAEVLNAYDEFISKHFPPSLAAAFEVSSRGTQEHSLFACLTRFLDCIESAKSTSEAFEIFVKTFIANAGGDICEDDCERKNVVANFIETVGDNLRTAENRGLAIPEIADVFEMVAAQAKSVFVAQKKHSDCLPLLDWMEIFWSPQPHLFLCDINYGIVPSSDFGDSFLSDGMRAKLGILNFAQRRRRDAYMLSAMSAWRRENGKCTILVPRLRGDASTAKPSPLLLQCKDAELPARVKLLFKQKDNSESTLPPFAASWKLKIPYAPLPNSLSPSAFKAYMACPFRFYLERVLRLDCFDESLSELNAADFGTIVHKVFERFGKSPQRDSENADEIKKVFSDILNSEFLKRFGSKISAPIIFQREASAAMLSRAAEIQAEHAAKGWRILYTELDATIQINSYPVKMRIDRVDTNADGDLMIIDYKIKNELSQSSGMSLPESYHRRRKRVDGGGADFEWTDLQLPIYKRAMLEKNPEANIICSYFALVSDLQLCEIYPWNIEQTLLQSAIEKASEIVAKIRARKFSPTDKKLLYDNWKEFFPFADGNLENYLEFEKEDLKNE